MLDDDCLCVNYDRSSWSWSGDTLQVVKIGGSGSGGTIPPRYHTYVVASDGLCLDSFGNTSNAEAIIDQWTCNGQPNQELQFVATWGGYGRHKPGLPALSR